MPQLREVGGRRSLKKKKGYSFYPKDGYIYIDESESHKMRREASFALHLKSFVPAFVLLNLLWILGKVMLTPFKCSALKSFEDQCGCTVGRRAIDGLRFYLICYGEMVLLWFYLLFKASRLRHGKVISPGGTHSSFMAKLSVFVPNEDNSVVGSGADDGDESDKTVTEDLTSGVQQKGLTTESEVAEKAQVTKPSLNETSGKKETAADDDSNLATLWGPFATPGLHPDDVVPLMDEGVRYVTKETIICGVGYCTTITLINGVLKGSVGTAILMYMVWQTLVMKRSIRVLSPSNHQAVVKPILRFMYLLVFCVAIITIATRMVEQDPSLAELVVIVFPFVISGLELMYIMAMGPVLTVWSDEDASTIARSIIQVIESFRAGLLLSAATLQESTSPFAGPYFKALLLGVLSDAIMRSDVAATLLMKLRGLSDEEVVNRRDRFVVLYMGCKTDAGYLPWILVLIMALHNTAPSTNMIDCDMKPYYVYSPPMEYMVVGIAGEVSADVLAVLVRRLISHFRPLWVVPLYHVGHEGSVVARTLLWLALSSAAVTVLSGTAMLLDQALIDEQQNLAAAG